MQAEAGALLDLGKGTAVGVRCKGKADLVMAKGGAKSDSGSGERGRGRGGAGRGRGRGRGGGSRGGGRGGSGGRRRGASEDPSLLSPAWISGLRGLRLPRNKPGSRSSSGVLGGIQGLEKLEVGGQVSPLGS